VGSFPLTLDARAQTAAATQKTEPDIRNHRYTSRGRFHQAVTPPCRHAALPPCRIAALPHCRIAARYPLDTGRASGPRNRAGTGETMDTNTISACVGAKRKIRPISHGGSRALALAAAALLLLAALPLGAQPKESVPTVLVEGGGFTMGATDRLSSNARPAHRVTLGDFRLAVCELTVADFRAFVADTGYVTTSERNGGAFVFSVAAGDGFFQHGKRDWRYPNFPQAEDAAVTAVSWFDAVHFCNWLSARDGLRPVYAITGDDVQADFRAAGWRLPTEAEWEYAARGGAVSRNTRYAGSDLLAEVAWCAADSRWVTHPGKLKKPNELGIYDLNGNVDEWCWDWYGSYSAEAQTNPTGPAAGLCRVQRGGNWYTNPELYEAPTLPFRSFTLPGNAYNTSGIRLARNP
jgi:formylglycine-generating enzyme required for sulfatase activity